MVVARYGVISHMNIFFTCKNSLVILLQLYRLLVLFVKKRPQYRWTKTDSFVLVYNVHISFRRHSLFSMLPIDDDEDLHLEEASDNDNTSIKDYKYKTKTPSTIALPANISTEGNVITCVAQERISLDLQNICNPFHYYGQEILPTRVQVT